MKLHYCPALLKTEMYPQAPPFQIWKYATGRAPSCPEIVFKSAIVLKFYSFGQNVLIWTFVIYAVATLFTSHDYVYVADVECQVMFSLVTLYCFMCRPY